MSNMTMSETFYGSREPNWLVESPKEVQSQFDRRGCVRQIRTSSYRSNPDEHTPGRRNEDLPSISSYPLEQPSGVNAERHAYVRTAVPTTHRTVGRPAMFNTMNTNVINIPIVEFMVPLCCGKCEEKVTEELESVQGVYQVVCDQHNQRVTVSSTLDPRRLLKRVKRVKKNSQFWGGSRFLKNVHHVPSLSRSDRSHRSDIPAYKPELAHHRSTSRISDQNQRYESRGVSYDPMETQYLERSSRAPQTEDPEFYAGADHHQYYRSSSYGASPFRASSDAPQVYSTRTPGYVSVPMDSSLHYGDLPPSYGPAYEYSGDYASTEYY